MTGNSSFDQKNQSVDSQVNISSQINNYSATAPLPVPYQIRQPPADFTGREEDIAEILANFDQGATITGLRGMGGVGKTALALVLAEMLKSRFPDGQIFLKMDGMSKNPLSPAEALSKVIQAFRGFKERLPEDQDDLQVLYNSVLAGKLVLILLDNAADGKQVEPLIPPKGCALLITSRKKFLLPGMPTPFFLDTLKPSDARNFLLKICSRIGNHSEELAKLCGHLPLALRATASLLTVKSDLNPSNYLEELRSERTRLKKIGKEGVDLDVEASFNLSYIRLPAETARVFRQLSVFPTDFDSHAEEFVCQDENHLNLSELVTLSLVEFLQAGRYRLHDLVRVFACLHPDNEVRGSLQMRHAEYYKNVLSKIDELYIKGEKDAIAGREIFDIESINIKSGQKLAEDMAIIQTDKKYLIPEMKPALQLCSDYASEGAYAIGMLLSPRERIHWLETALLASNLLKDTKKECGHLSNIGIAYVQVGEFHKAIDIFEKRFSLSRKIGDLLGASNAIGNLGTAYLANGDIPQAIKLFKQHLTFVRMNSDRRGEAKDLGNLGLAYVDLEKPQDAIEYCEQALKIFREIRDSQGEGAALGNLGLAYSKLGNTRKAIEYYEKHLAIASDVGDEWGKSKALINLGNSYADVGKTCKAIEYYQHALVVARESEERQQEENILENMGCAYYASSSFFEAIDCFKQALIIAREIGNKKLEENNLNYLGGAFYAAGDSYSAIEYYELALAAVRGIGDRQEEENILGNLGNAHIVLGDTVNAIDFYEQALSIARDIGDQLGESNGLINMSLSWNKLCHREKAVDLAKSALIILEQIESPNAEKIKQQLEEWEKS
ncbi:MAG: tetratricopeptide repeat protein [Methanothrix sp.]